MTISYRSLSVALLGLIANLGVACTDSDSSHDEASEVTLPELFNPSSAPKAIQRAANAVVRLRTARAAGTGSYISSTGLLLTNDHVLGTTVCPIEGCYVEVSRHYERGAAYSEPTILRAVPVTFDVGLDIAVLQLYGVESGKKPVTPDYLELDPRSSEALLGERVTVVGHPNGRLKKWSEGAVVDAAGSWLTTSNFILAGDSGSPLLSDEGKLVGIVHRGPSGLELISEQGVNAYAIGTASAALKTALDAPLPETAFSVEKADLQEWEFLNNDDLFLNAAKSEFTLTGQTTVTSALDVFGKACDEALNSPEATSFDAFFGALSPCFNAQSWLDCRKSETDTRFDPYGHLCPKSEDRDTWRERFQSLNAVQIALNGIADYESASQALAQLETTYDAGNQAGAQSLKATLELTKPPLDPELAFYLARFNITEYAGVKIRDYLLNYQDIPGYEFGGNYIVYGAIQLYVTGALNAKGLTRVLSNLMTDPKLGIGTRLVAETNLWEFGAL